MRLRPSEIRFTQDSINNVFDKKSSHRYVLIGKTLDDLLQGRCRISDIPIITVIERDGLWFTVDNRRLWVFRKLEELGYCTDIPVRMGYSIPSNKFTTCNRGVSVIVRGDAGGTYWKTCRRPATAEPSRPYSSLSLSNVTAHEATLMRPFSSLTLNASSYRNDYDQIYTRPDTTTPSLSFRSYDYGLQRRTEPSTTFSLPFFGSQNVKYLDPEKVRYTKETIKAPPFGTTYRHASPIDVYQAFDEHWVVDGNRRLWSFKEARRYETDLKVPAKVKDDEEEFLEKMREERPWLSLLDIIQMGETVKVE